MDYLFEPGPLEMLGIACVAVPVLLVGTITVLLVRLVRATRRRERRLEELVKRLDPWPADLPQKAAPEQPAIPPGYRLR